MTTKRFTIGMLKYYVNDNETNYCYALELQSDANHLCKLLNELHEENKYLKKEKLVGEPLELFKQNMLLKKNNKELREENERLRRCINTIYTIARLEEV